MLSLSNTKANIVILLATYNGQPFLEAQIKSYGVQLGVNTVVVVSDDCSCDATTDTLAKNITGQLVTLPWQKQGGASQNFFRLLRDADFTQFDYVALSDQDDIWQPEKLSHAVKTMQENNVDAYSANVTAFWPNGKQKLIDKAQPQREFDYMFESAGPGCTFVMTKKLALALQSFLIEHQNSCKAVSLHDWFIYAFARSRGYKWFIDPKSHMLYRQHASNVVGANVGFKAKLARWKKLREGWLINQALTISGLLGYSEAWPMKRLLRYSMYDRLVLIFNVGKLRRRLRDRIGLALFLLFPFKK